MDFFRLAMGGTGLFLSFDKWDKREWNCKGDILSGLLGGNHCTL